MGSLETYTHVIPMPELHVFFFYETKCLIYFLFHTLLISPVIFYSLFILIPLLYLFIIHSLRKIKRQKLMMIRETDQIQIDVHESSVTSHICITSTDS